MFHRAVDPACVDGDAIGAQERCLADRVRCVETPIGSDDEPPVRAAESIGEEVADRTMATRVAGLHGNPAVCDHLAGGQAEEHLFNCSVEVARLRLGAHVMDRAFLAVSPSDPWSG